MGDSDFLFVMPSFFNGVARSIDLFGTYSEYNFSASPEEADARAMHHDWQAVGKDMKAAVDKVKQEYSGIK